MAGSRTARLLRKIPVALRRDLERRSQVLGGEGEHYLELVMSLVDTLQPEDPIESMLVGQAADHAWHIARLRQIETSLLTPALPEPQAKNVARGPPDPYRMMAAWYQEKLISDHGYRDNGEYLDLKKRFEPDMHAEEKRLIEEDAARERDRQDSQHAAVAPAATPQALAKAYVTNSPHLEKVSRLKGALHRVCISGSNWDWTIMGFCSPDRGNTQSALAS